MSEENHLHLHTGRPTRECTMKTLKRLLRELRVIWNEDILYWIEDWYFWKFTFPKHYKANRCLRCGRTFADCECLDEDAMHI